MKVNVQHEVPVPRVYALVSPAPADTLLIIGFEISSRWGEPVIRVEAEFPWLRPRPWRCDVTVPPKGASDLVFGWRRPR